ncbi:MAG TPA: DUF2924 domain-containing protein [Thermoguttaceae bacterium]|nr:DUF2924 domain-containing protein [Thermoguttaceae bacterium]
MNVAKEVAALKRMTVSQLREKYREAFGHETRSRHKAFLVKRIIWRLQALKDAGFNLDVLAFDDKELAQLLAGDLKQGLTDADEVPEPPDEAVTRRGDLWILGDHRLLCGDSGSVADLDRLLDGATVQMVVTDPPYNVKVEPRSNNAIAAGNSSFTNPNKHHQPALPESQDSLVFHAKSARRTQKYKDRRTTHSWLRTTWKPRSPRTPPAPSRPAAIRAVWNNTP